jgi:hypothetical protein
MQPVRPSSWCLLLLSSLFLLSFLLRHGRRRLHLLRHHCSCRLRCRCCHHTTRAANSLTAATASVLSPSSPPLVSSSQPPVGSLSPPPLIPSPSSPPLVSSPSLPVSSRRYRCRLSRHRHRRLSSPTCCQTQAPRVALPPHKDSRAGGLQASLCRRNATYPVCAPEL